METERDECRIHFRPGRSWPHRGFSRFRRDHLWIFDNGQPYGYTAFDDADFMFTDGVGGLAETYYTTGASYHRPSKQFIPRISAGTSSAAGYRYDDSVDSSGKHEIHEGVSFISGDATLKYIFEEGDDDTLPLAIDDAGETFGFSTYLQARVGHDTGEHPFFRRRDGKTVDFYSKLPKKYWNQIQFTRDATQKARLNPNGDLVFTARLLKGPQGASYWTQSTLLLDAITGELSEIWIPDQAITDYSMSDKLMSGQKTATLLDDSGNPKVDANGAPLTALKAYMSSCRWR